MIATLYGCLLQTMRYTLGLAILLSFSTGVQAAENFTPGIYVNSATGDQYIVSGSTESNGRTLWTIASARNSSSYFSGIWETGPAIGNSLLAGTSNIVNHPDGYGPGRSYGVIGSNNFNNWFSGSFLAASGSGSMIAVAKLNADGSTWNQFTLTLLKAGALDSASEQYVPGIYRDRHGYGYLVSGAPSQPGRTIWTIVSLPDNPDNFNACWETGAAVGNGLLAGNSNISNHAAGYAAGRSYGVIGANSFNNWFSGSFLAAARAGDTLSISKLNADGSTWDQFGLIKENSNPVSSGTGSEHFSPGYYRSPDGKRYLVSGSNEITGRTLWTIASVSMPTIFNACWETGAAVGNSLLAGNSNIANHAAGYAAGRSYGVLGANSFNNWFSGSFFAAAQVGVTLSISKLNADGSTWDQLVLTQEPDPGGPIGPDTESYVAGTDYVDVWGRTYTVSGSSGLWSISGTNGTNFNAQWETGPAISNTLLAGSSYISSYPQGYLAGRSYGVIGSNNFNNWFSGSFLAAARAGATISLSRLNANGSTGDQFLITKGGTGGTGNAGKIALNAPVYYVNKFDGQAVIGVRRTDGGAGMVSAMYSAADGTAHSVSDYNPVTGGMLAWNDGDTATKFIHINIPTTAHGNTFFTITLSNPVGGAVIGPQATTTVTIFDNMTSFLDAKSRPAAYTTRHTPFIGRELA